MVARFWPALVLGLAASSTEISAQETYTLRFKDEGKGHVGLVNKNDTMEMKVSVTDAEGKSLLSQDEKSSETAVYKETILEREGANRPTRLERAYQKAVAQKGGKTEELPYQGKTVLIEKKDGKYHFKIKDGGEFSGASARFLSKEFNDNKESQPSLEKLVLPVGPVGLDQPWKLDMAPILKGMQEDTKMEVVAAQATGTGTLKRVYQNEGVPFAVIDIQLVLPIKSMGEGKQKVTLEAGSRMTYAITLDGCIDGSRTAGVLKGTFDLSGKANIPTPDGKQAKMTLVGQGTMQATQKEVAKE